MPVSRTHIQGARKAWGKKRKHEGGTGLSPSFKMSQHSSTRGCVSIDEIDLDGNFIRLRNSSDLVEPSRCSSQCFCCRCYGVLGGALVIEAESLMLQDQSLGGWVVKRTQPGAPDVSFKIPTSCVLGAGQTVSVQITYNTLLLERDLSMLRASLKGPKAATYNQRALLHFSI